MEIRVRVVRLRGVYRFLVLGPSRLGKSEVAQSWAPVGRSLFVHCCRAVEPHLLALRPLYHFLVVMDECTPQLVVANRTLFQSPAEYVRLGQSATNVHSYQVCLHGVIIVITTNNWRSMSSELCPEDQAWVVATCVYHYVDGPLWTDFPEHGVATPTE